MVTIIDGAVVEEQAIGGNFAHRPFVFFMGGDEPIQASLVLRHRTSIHALLKASSAVIRSGACSQGIAQLSWTSRFFTLEME